jgi:hypothetical protein
MVNCCYVGTCDEEWRNEPVTSVGCAYVGRIGVLGECRPLARNRVYVPGCMYGRCAQSPLLFPATDGCKTIVWSAGQRRRGVEGRSAHPQRRKHQGAQSKTDQAYKQQTTGASTWELLGSKKLNAIQRGNAALDRSRRMETLSAIALHNFDCGAIFARTI